jgi:hypothetical protein
MYKGTVTFSAKVRGNGLRFSLVEFNPYITGVTKVEVVGSTGKEIESVVYLDSIPTQQDAKALATKANDAMLDRIAYSQNVALDNARLTNEAFSRLDSGPSVIELQVSSSIHLSDAINVVNNADPV